MKKEVISALVILLVVVSGGVGYFVGRPSVRTQTVVTTYTVTTTLEGSDVMRCVVALYESWFIGEVSGNTTIMTTTARSYGPLQTYVTNGTEQTVGHTTVVTAYYTGVTLTGAIDEWNSTTCTYIGG